jgi:hypothetical protein
MTLVAKGRSGKVWAQFQIHTGREAKNHFDMTIVTAIGDDSNTLFLKGWVVEWKKNQDLAPNIFAMVPQKSSQPMQNRLGPPKNELDI